MKLKRKYITLEEELDYYWTLTSRDEVESSSWVARYQGPSDTEEEVVISRSSKHAGEALLLLEEAIREEGMVLE